MKTKVAVGLRLETLPKNKENKYAFLAVNESSVKNGFCPRVRLMSRAKTRFVLSVASKVFHSPVTPYIVSLCSTYSSRPFGGSVQFAKIFEHFIGFFKSLHVFKSIFSIAVDA